MKRIIYYICWPLATRVIIFDMLKICLLAVLLAVSLAKPNKAGYIHGPGRPLNIAHRGLCSILP